MTTVTNKYNNITNLNAYKLKKCQTKYIKKTTCMKITFKFKNIIWKKKYIKPKQNVYENVLYRKTSLYNLE